jgi:hypothetical protein
MNACGLCSGNGPSSSGSRPNPPAATTYATTYAAASRMDGTSTATAYPEYKSGTKMIIPFLL